MLDAVAKLPQDIHGDVSRTLGHEVDAHALASYEPDHLLYLVHHRLARVLEEHMCLVEEEDELWLVEVSYLRQLRVDVAHQPKQEGAVELRLKHQLVGGQHAHHALASFGLHQVLDVECRLAEELLGTLAFQLEDGTLYGTDAGSCYVSVFGGVFPRMLGHEVQRGAKVLDIQYLQTAFVGNAEDNVQHAVLGLVQAQQT